MLAYLVLQGTERPVRRAQLVRLLWPDFEPNSARTNLRSTLYRLRRLLAPLDLIESDYQTVRFRVEDPNFWCDALSVGVPDTRGSPDHEPLLQGFHLDDCPGFMQWLEERRAPSAHLPDRGTRADPPPPVDSSINWGEAPDVTLFYGRESELSRLADWITRDRCRLVALLGMGGTGKTTLATRLAVDLQADFERVLWVSLRNAPPIDELLDQCISFFGDATPAPLPATTTARLTLLLDSLRRKRCLLVLDNAESVLEAGEQTGHFREGYEAYGHLLQLVGDSPHRSCLLLTSREKPAELAAREGDRLPVRSLNLSRMEMNDARSMLSSKGLFGGEEEWSRLVEVYSGNPLALKIVAETVWELYNGEIRGFLNAVTETSVFGGVRVLLDQQFARLSSVERDILFWLAVEREAVDIDQLQENLLQPLPRSHLLQALTQLRRRSLVERVGFGRSHPEASAPTDREESIGLTLQNVVLEYVTGRLVEAICQEVAAARPLLFQSHALLKAQTVDYVRESQSRLIIEPIAKRLLAQLGMAGVETQMKRILSFLRRTPGHQTGYAAGNALNLLAALEADLRGWDFSGLAVRQADLRGVMLHETDFRQADFSNTVFSDAFSSILSLAYRPDGRWLAAGVTDGTIRIWQTHKGEPLLSWQSHVGFVHSIAFSPNGELLAGGGDSPKIFVWDTRNGQPTAALDGFSGSIYSVAFSPDGNLIAGAGADGSARLWEVAGSRCVQTLHGHTGPIRSVAFAPAGRTLLTAGQDRTVVLWDVADGRRMITLHGHTDRVWSVCFSPDGSRAASSGEDGTVRIWEIETSPPQGRCLHVLEGHQGRVQSICFSPSGALLVSGDFDGAIHIWDALTGRCLDRFAAHGNRVCAVSFSPDGTSLASGGYDQRICLWNIQGGAGAARRLKTLSGHSNWVWSVDFHPQGRLLATGSGDHSVHLWDVEKGCHLHVLRGHKNRVTSVCFSADGNYLASSSHDRSVRLWDVHSRRSLAIYREFNDILESIAMSPDGYLLAGAGFNHSIYLWDIPKGERMVTLRGHTEQVWSVAFSPTGDRLLSGSYDGTVRVWEVATGRCLRVLEGHTHWVGPVDFSPDGRTGASGSVDRCVRLWNLVTGECIHTLPHDSPINAVTFSPDGRFLACGASNRNGYLWDVSSGSLLHTLQGHATALSSVSFGPDNRTVVSGSDDETIRLWDVQTGEALRVFYADRLYARMKIAGVAGLTAGQRTTLTTLGAVE